MLLFVGLRTKRVSESSLAATALLSCADVCRSHGWRVASPAGQAQPQTASSAAPQLAGEQAVICS